MRVRLDPLSLISSLAILGIASLLIHDTFALSIMLTVEVIACALFVSAYRSALRRLCLPLLGLSGVVWVNWLATNSVDAALASGLRVATVIIPGVALLPMIDATHLADGLAQRWHLPARVILPVLAAIRLLESLRSEWVDLQAARRVRGVGPSSLHQRIREFPELVFGLLVQALRRADRLAIAMQTRGIDHGHRSWVRTSTPGLIDRFLLWTTVALCVGSFALAHV